MKRVSVWFYCLCILIHGCERAENSTKSASTEAASTHHQSLVLEESIFGASGKKLSLIMSLARSANTDGYSETAQLQLSSKQQWMIRIIDEEGLPVENAELRLILSYPFEPLTGDGQKMVFILPDEHDGDGFYRTDKIQFDRAGRWSLDYEISWTDNAEYAQQDHVSLNLEIFTHAR